MDRQDFERLHAAPMGIAAILMGAGPAGVIGLFLVLCLAGLGLFAFVTVMENLREAIPLAALLACGIGVRFLGRAMAREGATPRKAALVTCGAALAAILLVEGASGQVGNAVARITAFNPSVALQGATGIAIGPLAAAAGRDGTLARTGRDACLAARADGRLARGREEDARLAYDCRLVIGTGHMHRFCANLYRPRYDPTLRTYDNGTPCGPYLHRYYWQKFD